ncbi:MAG: hypothetical protein OCC46_05010 [Pseudodesulfovibrio sp.]
MDQILSWQIQAAKFYVLKADIFATFCGGSAKKSARLAGHGGSLRQELLSLELSPDSSIAAFKQPPSSLLLSPLYLLQLSFKYFPSTLLYM